MPSTLLPVPLSGWLIDLETTGLVPGRDAILEVGAARLQDGVIVERFSSLVRHKGPVAPAILRLTGIDPAELVAAPDRQDVMAELWQRVGDAPLIAHNAGFEAGFLGQALGRPLHNPFLDTCILAAMLRPELESHSLDELRHHLSLPPRAHHRALADAEDLLALVENLFDGVVSGRQRQLVETLIGLTAPAGWPWAAVLADWLPHIRPDRPAPDHVAPRRLPRLGPVNADGWLDVIAAGSPDRAPLEPREPQRRMLEAVSKAMATDQVAMIEAGTGTGKSLAYLLPAIAHARRTGKIVVVAPHMRSLQDQLASKDLPMLKDALPEDFRFAVMKGMSNYLCLRKLHEETDELAHAADRSAALSLAYFHARSILAPDQDLERVSFFLNKALPEFGTIKHHLQATQASCDASDCAFAAQCPYFRALDAARAADVIIANHALALQWPKALPDYQVLVVDEAHALLDSATTVFGHEVTEGQLQTLVNLTAGRAGRPGLLHRLAATALRSDTWPGDPHALTALVRQTEAAVFGISRAGATIHEALTVLRQDDPGLRQTHDWATPVDGVIGNALDALIASLRTALLAMHELRLAVAPDVDEAAPPLRGVLETLQGIYADLHAHRRALQSMREARYPRKYAYMLERQGSTPFASWTVAAKPINVAGPLADKIYAKCDAVILTSATLQLGDRPFMMHQLGVAFVDEQRRAPFLSVGSPYDPRKQARCFIIDDMADISREPDRFCHQTAQVIGEMARHDGGRVLGLFASRSRVTTVAQYLDSYPDLITVAQNRDGSRNKLTSQFRQGRADVLLGTRSLWEGVDIAGDALRTVVIDKLPFGFRGEPLTKARHAAIEARGGVGFRDYDLPSALLQLRQGIGRLLRGSRDCGVIIILASQLPQKSYWRQVRQALSDWHIEVGPAHWVLAEAKRSLKGWSIVDIPDVQTGTETEQQPVLPVGEPVRIHRRAV